MNSTLAALTFALWTPTIPTEELSRILPAWRYGGKTNLSVWWLPAVVVGWWQCRQEAWRAGEVRHQTWQARDFLLCSPWLAGLCLGSKRKKPECRKDKHRNRCTGGKDWRNTPGLTAWGTNTESGRVWELQLKSFQGSSRLWTKTRGETDCKVTAGTSSCQCWES